MKYYELERIKRAVALDLARMALVGADWSFEDGVNKLTEIQQDSYDWLEMLYYDGEITYRELWQLCRPSPLPEP